jgi:hypothetical protein
MGQHGELMRQAPVREHLGDVRFPRARAHEALEEAVCLAELGNEYRSWPRAVARGCLRHPTYP